MIFFSVWDLILHYSISALPFIEPLFLYSSLHRAIIFLFFPWAFLYFSMLHRLISVLPFIEPSIFCSSLHRANIFLFFPWPLLYSFLYMSCQIELKSVFLPLYTLLMRHILPFIHLFIFLFSKIFPLLKWVLFNDISK